MRHCWRAYEKTNRRTNRRLNHRECCIADDSGCHLDMDRHRRYGVKNVGKYLAEREKAYKDFIMAVMATPPFRQLNNLAESVAGWISERLEGATER